MIPVRDRLRSEGRGFALVVTVALMVLLVMIALGLLSISSIALRSQGHGEALAIARANARIALMIAIGELQKQAGPDQRLTATADIAGKADGSPLPSGDVPGNDESLDGTLKGLGPVYPGTRHWTGVFVNRDAPDTIFSKTPSAQVRGWLVSGTEALAPGQPAITPDIPSCVVGVDGKLPDSRAAAILVGGGSVGAPSIARDAFVAAPLVEVKKSPGSAMDGAYSWWIGDEGVKSRINMERTHEVDDEYASWIAQRRGWEMVDRFTGYPVSEGDADRDLPKIATLATAECLLPALRNGAPSARQSVFHAAAVQSRGVIADPLNGGLRVDLTKAFVNGLPSRAPTRTYDNYPVAGGRVIPEAAAPRGRNEPEHLPMLRWDHLLRFFRLHEELSGGVLKVTPRNGPDGVAIAPLVSDFRILMGVRLKGTVSGRVETGPYRVTPCGKVVIAIANPYPYPLEWDRDLDFEIKNLTPAANGPSRVWQVQSAVFIPKGYPSTEPAVFNQAVFRISRGRLEPGEARAYTQTRGVLRSRAGAVVEQVVPLSPVSQTNPFDFNQCVEVENTATINLPRGLDIRERWQTTQVMLEMRLAGVSGPNSWLRRLEQFELDNGYSQPNTRRFDDADSRFFRNGPVPLMHYSFQISQPGMDYGSLMPAGYEMGQRSSTVRTFADFNLQAARFSKLITSYNPPPYFMESNDSIAQLGAVSDAGTTGLGFTRNLAVDPLFWGRSSVNGSRRTVLFSIPEKFVSLAQFQHADLTNDDVELSISHQPGNAFGNSYATPFVKRHLTNQKRTDYVLIGIQDRDGATRSERFYYDISHILNNSIWDRYFLSTIETGSSEPESPAMVFANGVSELSSDDPSKVAGSLMIEGAFNVNSTSESAWRALFASTRSFRHPADQRTIQEAAFPRSLEQPAGNATPATGEGEDSFAGYRRLTDEEISALATEMVRQVRLRGPFLSLSHFINRALVDINENPALGRSGALQQALDESGVNISIDGRRKGLARVNVAADRVTLASKQGAPRADLDGGNLSDRPTDVNPSEPDWARTSRDNNFGAMASIIADRDMILSSRVKPEQGYRSTGIPGWVTQADVLQSIGPLIAVRSDTFRIRTYGEARDGSGKVVATAWCEAVVQRSPEYVDPTNAPSVRPGDLTATNQTYGRRFDIVAFRWLAREEV